MEIVISILALSFLVIIHEIGHYLAAKWAGVAVEEFGIGYPPKAFTLFRKWGTNFTVNWIPFGGFVRMKGEGATWEEEQASSKKKDAKDSFFQKPTHKKLIIIMAGAGINFLFGVLAFAIVFSLTGIPTLWERPRIIDLQPNTPAAVAHIPTHVDIVSIKHSGGETPIESRQQAIDTIDAHRGETVTIVTTGTCSGFECNESRHEFSALVRTPEQTPPNEGAMGIVFQLTYPQFYPWYEMPFRGVVVGIQQAVGLAIFIAQAFVGMVMQGVRQGVVPSELMSPVGIVDEIGRSGVVQEGALALLQLTGMISVNLAILNVMPIPALDGSQAVFIVLKKFVKKRKLAQVEMYVQYAGLLLLVALLLFLSIRDIYSIIIR